jgi:hypothetical protein
MTQGLSTEDIRKKFKEETGKDAILKSIKESAYRSGYPKKIRLETYNPLYTVWLEKFLIQNSI